MRRCRGILPVIAAFVIASACFAAPAGIAIWQTLPWLGEDENCAPALRAMMPAGKVLAQMADAEYEPLCLTVRNDSGEWLSYRVDVEALRKGVPGLKVDVLASWLTPIRFGHFKTPALEALGADGRFGNPRDCGEALFESSRSRVFHVPQGESRSFWLLLHTVGVKPGVYRAPLTLTSVVDGTPVVSCEVVVQVWPFVLPEKLDIGCYNWDYGCDEDSLADMREHKVNTFMIADLPNKFAINPDGTVSGDMELARIRMKRKIVPWAKFIGSYGFFADYIDWTKKNKIEYMSPEFKEGFAKAIRYAVSELKKAGLDYDDFMFQHIDEAYGPKAKQVVEMGRLAREIDPKVRWALTCMSSLQEIKNMAPYTDCIMKRGEAFWSADDIAFFREYQKAGGPVWQFKQTGIERGKGQVHMYNRLRQWRTWNMRADGAATFVYSAAPYQWQHDPITVRSWEAARESNEDYQYFAMVRDMAAKAGLDQRAEAVAFVDRLVQGVIGPAAPGTGMLYAPEHPAVMMAPYRARKRMAERIAALKGVEVDTTLDYAPAWEGKPVDTSASAVALISTRQAVGGVVAPNRATDLLVTADTARGTEYLTLSGAWAGNEFAVAQQGVLEPGNTYTLSFQVQWPDEIMGGTVVLDGVGAWPMSKGDAEWAAFEQTFVATGADLSLHLREFRAMDGDKVTGEAEWRNMRLVRKDAGAPLPGPTAPRVVVLKEARAVKLTSPSSHAPIAWTSDTALLSAGCRYRIALRYRALGLVHDAVNVVSTEQRKGRRGRLQPKYVPFAVSLPDTGGAWRALDETFTVPRSGEYRVSLTAKCQRPDGPAEFDVAGLDVGFVDVAPVRALADDVRRVHAQRVALAGSFKNRRDPLVLSVEREAASLQKLLRQAEGAVPGQGPAPEKVAQGLEVIRGGWLKRPYATFSADPNQLPLPASAPSSDVAYGIPQGGKARPPMPGAIPQPGGLMPRAAAIGITNFCHLPLCFMIKAGPAMNWNPCGRRAKGEKPEPRFVVEGGKHRGTYYEFVVPPGETRYLWAGESGKLDLLSTDKRIPGVLFDIDVAR